MAAVYGIVKNHSGGITIDSEPARGTAVNLCLPATAPTIKSLKKKADSPDVVHGNGTILIVDDEPIVLDVGRSILKKIGYRVRTCTSGKEAIEVLQAEDLEIDLVLLDIKLPDMNGADILDYSKHQHPDLKVIICSGYALADPDRDLLKSGADDFIQKPFSISELSTKIGQLLSS